MIREQDILHIGRIQRTHGTAGELQCRMLNTCWEDSDATFIILNLDEIFVPFRVNDWRTKGSEDVLLSLQGIQSEQQAARLVGAEAYMLRSDLSEETDEPMDYEQLVGYKLCDVERGEIGTIAAVDTSTLNTLVQLDSGLLLPLHEDFVCEVNTGKRTLAVRLPEGLIRVNSE